MSKFVLEPLNDVNGDLDFFKILEDGECYWNDFCLDIEKQGTWEYQLDQLKAIMDDVANKKLLPHNKFKKLDPPKTDEYEVKTRDLRAYLLLDSNGFIIIYASKKSEQDEAIRAFRQIKNRYLKAENVERKPA